MSEPSENTMLRTPRTATHHPLQLLTLLLIGALLLAVAPTAFAATGGKEGSWGAFFGRLHVVVLHLPIGLLVGAFVIEVFGVFRRSRGFDIAAAWLFVLGFIASIVAVVTGLLLGTEQVTDPSVTMWTMLFADEDVGVSETLSLHMWLGTTMMVLAGVAAFLKILAIRKQWVDPASSVPDRGGWPLGVARICLILVMTAMPFVGHLGGNMTKGQEYLTERAPADWLVDGINVLNAGTTEEPAVVKLPPKDEDGNEIEVEQGTAAFWTVKIQPVMDVHCTACHDGVKQNGGLRLDTLEWALKGGEFAGENNVIAYDYELKSEIYRRVVLPHSHDEHMPTNKKKYGIMSQEDIHMLGEWLMEFDGKLDSGTVPAETAGADEADTPDEPEPIIAPEAIKAITSAGGNAQSLSQEEDPDLLTVKFAYLKELDPATVAKLESGADNIAWLTFEGSGFGDDAAKELPDMAKLAKLNLKDSAITDAGLAELPEMPSLVWLNLFGTEVTDAGLDALKKFDTLEKLYLTGTKVSAEGVKALREAMPDTEVFSDHDGQFQFAPVTPEVTPGDPAKDDKATTDQAAKPVNDKCPVSGAPVKPGFVSTFEGKTVGFCCNNCKGKFDANPAQFKAKIQ